MKNYFYASWVLLLFVLPQATLFARSGEKAATLSEARRFTAGKGFQENKGQVRDQLGNKRTDIDFQLKDGNMSLFIGNGKIRYQQQKLMQQSGVPNFLGKALDRPVRLETYRVELCLLGANTAARVETSSPLPYISYFHGTGIPEQGYSVQSFRKLRYKDIYPNIDWVIYIKEEGIEYDFVVRPGGNITDIKMEYLGAERVEHNPDGGLTIQTPLGSIWESRPLTYQQDGKIIPSAFSVRNNKVSFQTARYEGVLTIDPKVKWATYYGGDFMFDMTVDMKADGKGNLYVAGQTSSSNIATSGGFQNTISGIVDAFLCKYDYEGKLIWGTYYGGPGLDRGVAVAIDHTDKPYLSLLNTDAAPGLATTGAHQTVPGGVGDFVIVKFNENGERLWATYYGGVLEEHGGKNLLIHNGALYLFGSTESADNIASSGAEATSLKGINNFFLAKFTLEGERIWSTYIQGTDTIGYGGAYAICHDRKGNIYLGGSRNGGQGWATPGAHQSMHSSGNRVFANDAMLFKFDTAGRKLWSTYYGGEHDDACAGLVCDAWDNVYMGGTTKSPTNIASSGAWQNTIGNTDDTDDFFVAKFDSTGKRLWGTYIGGTKGDGLQGMGILNDKQIMIAGSTYSTDIKIVGAPIRSTHNGMQDVYVGLLDLSGNLQWSSFYGDTGDDLGTAACISRSNVYVGGHTSSANNIATPGAQQDVYGNPMMFSGFLMGICFADVRESDFIAGPDSVCHDQLHTYSVPDIGDIEACIWTLPDGWYGASTDLSIDVTNNGLGGVISVRVIRCGDTSMPSQLPVYIYPVTEAEITIDGFTLSTLNKHKSYQWLLNNELIPGATGETYRVTENGHYRVVTEDNYGCMDTSNVYIVNNVDIGSTQSPAISVRIYPNPSTDVLHIRSAVAAYTTITAVDGKRMVSGSAARLIDISSFTPGIYLVEVRDSAGMLLLNSKMVKM